MACAPEVKVNKCCLIRPHSLKLGPIAPTGSSCVCCLEFTAKKTQPEPFSLLTYVVNYSFFCFAPKVHAFVLSVNFVFLGAQCLGFGPHFSSCFCKACLKPPIWSCPVNCGSRLYQKVPVLDLYSKFQLWSCF